MHPRSAPGPGPVGLLAAGLAAALLSGCAQLGAGAPSELPRDVHAAPDALEIAAHPCRFGDVGRCVSRCTADDPQACNAAGVLFEFGVVDEGPRTDLATASTFYEQSCQGNYAQGCNNLAWLYLRGRGVPKDPPHAMLLFMAAFDAAKLACARGDASGCLLAGEMLYDGRVSGEPHEELALFEQACRGGEPRGCAR